MFSPLGSRCVDWLFVGISGERSSLLLNKVAVAPRADSPQLGSRLYKSLYVSLAGWLQASEKGGHGIILAAVLSFKTSLCSSQLGGI